MNKKELEKALEKIEKDHRDLIKEYGDLIIKQERMEEEYKSMKLSYDERYHSILELDTRIKKKDVIIGSMNDRMLFLERVIEHMMRKG